jgi:hypothetical protein
VALTSIRMVVSASLPCFWWSFHRYYTSSGLYLAPVLPGVLTTILRVVFYLATVLPVVLPSLLSFHVLHLAIELPVSLYLATVLPVVFPSFLYFQGYFPSLLCVQGSLPHYCTSSGLYLAIVLPCIPVVLTRSSRLWGSYPETSLPLSFRCPGLLYSRMALHIRYSP